MVEKVTVKKDIVIIGAGIAGLTAALYSGRMNLETMVLENAIVGGQIANATGIENYPGFMSIAGKDLIETVQKQAENVGAVIDEFDVIERLELQNKVKLVETANYIYETPVVIIANTIKGRGVSFMENNAGWHGKAPKKEDFERAMAELL